MACKVFRQAHTDKEVSAAPACRSTAVGAGWEEGWAMQRSREGVCVGTRTGMRSGSEEPGDDTRGAREGGREGAGGRGRAGRRSWGMSA